MAMRTPGVAHPMKELYGLGLCSGISGLELGVRAAVGPRYRVVCHVERDPYAAAALVARMEDKAMDPAPIWDDLESFDGRAWRGIVSVVTCGFPCQPFSVAGKQRGTADPRWLWPHIHRILLEVEPRVVFLENVPGVVSHGLEDVLGTLAELGLDAMWDLFRASDVGAPHRRTRWFCLALSDAFRDELRDESGWSGGSSRPGPTRPVSDRSEVGVGHLEGLGLERSSGVRDEDAARRNDADGCDAAVGNPDEQGLEGRPLLGCGRSDLRPAWPPGREDPRWADWDGPQPAIRRMPDGTTAGLEFRTDRLRVLGNAVVPQQAELAFRILASR